MDKTNMTPEARCKRYCELFEKIPGNDTRARLDWLVANLHCSRKTAIIWRSPTTTRPIPIAKLAILERMLAEARK